MKVSELGHCIWEIVILSSTQRNRSDRWMDEIELLQLLAKKMCVGCWVVEVK